MAHSHKHTHTHHNHSEIKGSKLILSIFFNLIITIAEIIGGLLSQSLSLIADSLHNLSDCLAILISYFALKISKKKATLKNTYGYKRIEILAALINSSMLIIISFFLFKEAVIRFFHPKPINTEIMFLVALIGLLGNLFSVLLLKKDSKNNINIKSAYIHLISDTLSSVAVVIGSIFIYFLKIYWLDPILTIIIGIYVLKESFLILLEAIGIFMQAVPANIDVIKIKHDIEKILQVKNLHHVHIWSLNDKEIFFEGHIELHKDVDINKMDQTRLKIEHLLNEHYGIGHSTIQFECVGCKNNNLIHH